VNFDDTARFFGPSDKLWPDLFRPPDRRVTKLCLDCRRREVRPRQWYCPDCARKNKRDSNRRHIRRKRGLDVGKLANSPIRAEALTKAEKQVGYPYPKTSISGSSFPTGQRAATRNAREKESISLPGES
jgi:hypothetical protein